MFPFQRSGELSFQTNEFVAFVGEEEQNKDDNQNNWTEDATSAGVQGSMNTNVGLGHNNDRRRGRGRGRGGKSNFSPDSTSNCNDNNDDLKKKAIHRENERQRRMEMSDLYSTLRSTLPSEYIKGKRSITDHLAEAVNYIKDLEKNVKELADRRDQLEAAQEWTAPTCQVGGSSNPRPCPGRVMIHPRLDGLEIDINVDYEDESFSLSSALQVVFEEGISVSSCYSTKVNERMFHKMVCEVTDLTCIDFSRLHQRLNDLVC